jgi:hypothetical protein
MKSKAIFCAAQLALLGHAFAADGKPFDFGGHWRVDSIVGYSEISVGDDQLKKLIGQTVDISKAGVKIGTDDCRADAMRVRLRDTSTLLRDEYKAARKDAGLPAQTLTLDAAPCGYVFRLGRDIVFNQDGAFYRASRLRD